MNLLFAGGFRIDRGFGFSVYGLGMCGLQFLRVVCRTSSLGFMWVFISAFMMYRGWMGGS